MPTARKYKYQPGVMENWYANKQFLVIHSTDFTPDTALVVEVIYSFVLIIWRNAEKTIVNQTEEEQEMN